VTERQMFYLRAALERGIVKLGRRITWFTAET